MQENYPDRVSLKLARRDGFTLEAAFPFPAEGITAIFGPSGSGKTTVLRCVAGLERAEGLVSVGGKLWQDSEQGIFLPTWQRPLGYVFQEASLFPHLTARKNLEFAVKRSQSKSAMHRVDIAIELLGIEKLLDRKPHELSGGERQRVAIARAVATEPVIMLFDEPLAALDFQRKAEILPWLEKLKGELKIPMLYVTHSAEEVIKLADNLVVLEKGKLKVQGPLEQVLANVKLPVSLGGDIGVVWKGSVTEKDSTWNLERFSTGHNAVWLADASKNVADKIAVRILAKNVALSCEKPEQSSFQNVIPGVVTEIAPCPEPADCFVKLDCAGDPLVALVTRKAVSEMQLAEGKPVWALVKANSLSS